MLPQESLFVLDKATLTRHGGEPLFRDLNWRLAAGETWAIVGPNGSGKTALAEVVLGKHCLAAGNRTWPELEKRGIAWPGEVCRLVCFREDSWRFSPSRHYYQQRFNFIEPQDDVTLDAFLRSGHVVADDEYEKAVTRLGLTELRERSLIQLSSGQMRRARIAQALLARPELLILDEPFLGLDVAGRVEADNFLRELRDSGLQLLLVTGAEKLPEWITHVVAMDKLSIRWQGTRHDFEVRYSGACAMPTALRGDAASGADTLVPVIAMKDVQVRYGQQWILRDINWTVHAGARWAVLGPNGSGKTTLLSLLVGDHPQAYANDLWLFGQKRGTGESIWDIKRRVGFVSPELHLYFSEPLDAFRTAATGFFDVLTPRRTTLEQDAIVRAWFERFHIANLAERPFARLSLGEQRLVLLIRALVKDAPLLILDEPFQGLDNRRMLEVRDVLDQSLRGEQTLIFVSHCDEEIPRSVDRVLRLEAPATG